MKLQIAIPQKLADQLNQLALQENRDLRQQAEWLLWQAIAQAVERRQPRVEVSYAAKQ